MKEKAVLHPVGVFCPNDNTGFVSRVLGKDTAESMRNLIQSVINIKRKTMPELEDVLVIADGGGSNIANGVTWTGELLHLTEEILLPVTVCHTPPGSSKYNKIEHSMFSYISMHWKGKPFLTIQHVARYISETTTKTGLKIQCWFDKKRYLTNAEKREIGEDVLTRKQLDELEKGRIVHPYSRENDMYKWNYTVYPPKMAKAAA